MKLGQSYSETMPSPMKDKEYFPSFTYEGDKSLDLPEEGEMTIKFKRRRETETTDEDGKTHYSCTVDVTEIVDVEDTEQETAEPKTEEILDKLMEKIQAEKKKEY